MSPNRTDRNYNNSFLATVSTNQKPAESHVTEILPCDWRIIMTYFAFSIKSHINKGESQGSFLSVDEKNKLK